jgi:hypothetical protein
MTAWQHCDRGPVTEEKLLRAVNVLADIVEQHGPAHRPLYQAMKRELAALRRQKKQDAIASDQLKTAEVRSVA